MGFDILMPRKGAVSMEGYLIIAIWIRFFTDFFVIMGINRLLMPGENSFRCFLGAAVGGVYAAGCSVLPWDFLSHPVCYGGSLVLICLMAFGVSREALRKWAMFCLLRLGMDGDSTGEMVISFLLFCVCLYGFRRSGKKVYVTVEMQYRDRKIKLQALYDTGHQLTDPITGKPVLVVGADVARLLTGLTPQQLQQPVENIGAIPGLRLIPYQTVSRTGEMMLALQPEKMKIGKRKRCFLVAFAPQVLDESGKYQGLIGGKV